MNCEDLKRKVSIRAVLESFKLFPVKENTRTAFYFALDREEKIPSFSVDFLKNKAYDFGTGKTYDVISIVQLMNRCCISDALKYLEKFNFSSKLIDKSEKCSLSKTYRILSEGEIQHPGLIQYLKSRKVYEQKGLVKEIFYDLKGKKYFGIGFYNNSGGIEIRNKYSKICLGTKDITLIKNKFIESKEVIIFEGFFDYLTYKNLERQDHSNVDYLILNSTAMLFKADDDLKQYSSISLFLDNDDNGNTTKRLIKGRYSYVDDCSLVYGGFKDLNEWFCTGQ
ncbi:toprim domain-containing protein [Chryseobacterium wangxinyae]|uniref:toprim domain-containing protein n=1 Tax=Chryseobacterium sp. CY350 TaxID=2997336 RepID=UPI00226E37D3|nr:toprim domain-containing protein [Chryseobacterium sp. CY350]MCY0977151.1 toprim domain-containing protein [Chryseobacterium sp. CY350]WBZ95828.1 toprim domain-containing protein [Chryseobacterium sp. CY350]